MLLAPFIRKVPEAGRQMLQIL